MTPAACSAPDCTRPAITKGLCSTHYQRMRRTGSLARYGNRKPNITGTCAGCGATIKVQAGQAARGEGRYCSVGCKADAQRGVELRPGGSYTRQDGYVAVKIGIRQYQLEHRLVMEQAIGRPLRTDEHVHHLNGDRADNRLENLQLMSNEDHQRLHDHLGVNHAPTLITIECERCGVSFQRKPSRAVTARFCGNDCRLAALHERPRTT